MNLWIDGGCRNNGYTNARAATAVVQELRGHWLTHRRAFDDHPTSQRAELAAALEIAVAKQEVIGGHVFMCVTIHTDSKYLYHFETDWYRKWEQNAWLNVRGEPVVNQDLMKKALALERTILSRGKVDWIWVPRTKNEMADKAVNEELDELENW